MSFFPLQVIARSFTDAGHKVETEVLAPLARWQEVYTQLRVSNLPGLERPGRQPAKDEGAPAHLPGLHPPNLTSLHQRACLPASQARFQEVEATRLEVDSRRRTVADLSRRMDTMRARLGKGGDAKMETALEATIKRLQHKEGKLQGGLGAWCAAAGRLPALGHACTSVGRALRAPRYAAAAAVQGRPCSTPALSQVRSPADLH